MIQALLPVMDDFTVFSSSVPAAAPSNTLMPGSVIRETGGLHVEWESSQDDSDA
jgi:hypothetical protein